MSSSLVDDELLARAAKLYRNVPAAGTVFTMVDAMTHVGMATILAETRAYMNRMKVHVESVIQQEGPVRFDDTNDGKLQRVMLLLSLIPGEPKLAAVMHLAGCRQEEVPLPAPKQGPTALYMRCLRQRKKLKKAKAGLNAQHALQVPAPRVPPAPSRTPAQAPPIINVRAASMYTGEILSPLSASDTSSGPPPIPRSRPPANASIFSLTTSGTTRKTSKEKQNQRYTQQEKIDLDTSAYKVGTQLYDTVIKNRNTLEKFKTPDGCAAAVNQMFGIELVSGRRISNGVKDGQVG